MSGLMVVIAMVGCQEPPTSVDTSHTPDVSAPLDPGEDPSWVDPLDADVPELAVPRILINEILAANDSTFPSPAGTLSDFVELYNASDEAVELDRIELEDDSGDDWTGGDGVLQPGQRLLIWCDDDVDDPDFAPFGIASSGDHLTVTVDGIPTDRVWTGELPADVALARYPDGQAWLPSIYPTPGWPNRRPNGSISPKETIYQDDVITDIFLTLADEATTTLNQGHEVEASMSFEAVHFPRIGLRLKGSGSWDNLNGKPGLRIDMNEFVPGQRLRGLKGLVLNNGNHDATWAHEYITYFVYRSAGLPAPRVGWSRVYINNDYYGLYMNVEAHDDVWLEEWYADPDGILYEGTWSDFTPGQEHTMDYEEGPWPPDLDPAQEMAALLSQPSSDATIAELEQYLDVEQFLEYMALETLTMHWDGYKSPNNWRFYHDPTTDLFQWIPTGVDWTLMYDWSPLYSGNGEIFRYCLDNPGCKQRYGEATLRMCDLWDTLPLEEMLDHTIDLLDEEIAVDPRKQHNTSITESERQTTRMNLQSQADRVRAMVEP